MTTAPEALERLRNGNRRFVAGVPTPREDSARRAALVAAQEPFAVVLGCSDSRVPPEIVFDQGIGDLFIIRLAGNVVSPPAIGSVEYGVEVLGARLVIVLGHSGCGAVRAAVDDLTTPGSESSAGLRAILDRVEPQVEPLLESHPSLGDALIDEAVRANVGASAAQLRTRSPVLARLIRDDGLLIVGAEYSLVSGVVDFFDGMPAG